VALGASLFAAGALMYTRANFSLARQGQVTDCYTKVIEQLGSDKLDVRIGGIYALEKHKGASRSASRSTRRASGSRAVSAQIDEAIFRPAQEGIHRETSSTSSTGCSHG
jgi:hypothetical protein